MATQDGIVDFKKEVEKLFIIQSPIAKTVNQQRVSRRSDGKYEIKNVGNHVIVIKVVGKIDSKYNLYCNMDMDVFKIVNQLTIRVGTKGNNIRSIDDIKFQQNSNNLAH